MNLSLSSNTQAILLLTAPLIAGRTPSSSEMLSPGEYKRFAKHLQHKRHEPADLLRLTPAELARTCEPIVESGRVQRLLGRGFALSQAMETWQTRAIWVVSRADNQYPAYIKTRLRDDSPPILYGCGNTNLLETGGLAVVGSRHVDPSLVAYTMDIGRLAADAGTAIISGGARGIDQAAMRGALEAGGRVVGVLADSLLKTCMNRENRNFILDEQLTLISPYDPNAGFNVGNAMQRNKLIYALADAALVVNSDVNKGGTWAGAVEQLDKRMLTPVYVRSTGAASSGLDALRKKGALPWPNPKEADHLPLVFDVEMPETNTHFQSELSLSATNDAADTPLTLHETSKAFDNSQSDKAKRRSDGPADLRSEVIEEPVVTPENNPATASSASTGVPASSSPVAETDMAEELFGVARQMIVRLLTTPMKDAEVADALGLSKTQAKAWLARLVEEKALLKLSKPIRYAVPAERVSEKNKR